VTIRGYNRRQLKSHHTHVYSVLGDIEFQHWQCIAELIDNAFDEFLRNPDLSSGVDPTVGGKTTRGRAQHLLIATNDHARKRRPKAPGAAVPNP
jgi:hypothetical protein